MKIRILIPLIIPDVNYYSSHLYDRQCSIWN